MTEWIDFIYLTDFILGADVVGGTSFTETEIENIVPISVSVTT